MTLITEHFMLQNESAKRLYHEYVKDMPIYDFHCHLDPKDIAEDTKYTTITELWLAGDHYKWRAMRACGVSERLITGDSTDKEKFFAWAATVPKLLGNPLYHWTHLELDYYFGIKTLLNEETAEEIWTNTNRQLQEGALTVRSLITTSNVNTIFTTDEVTSTLDYHKLIHDDVNVKVDVLPTFRPDKALQSENPGFQHFLTKLESITNTTINTYESFLHALDQRINDFHKQGCRASDHGLGTFSYHSIRVEEAANIFKRILAGEIVSANEHDLLRSATLLFLAKRYHAHGWAMQLHIGPLRNNNHAAYKQIGPDSGFDSIHDSNYAVGLNRFFNELEQTNELPKTICYNLDWTKNEMIASALGNFQKEGMPGKMQLGSGWWFNDTKDGMRRQLASLANIGVLSQFVGMLTDSRSFLSFTRHDYFRRILCQLLGEWIEDGEIPADYDLVGRMAQDISYTNAERYFQ
ncbi:glucuronate isomerase [Shouchella patagoniensis]|uniref:glucuronate isomerase n=1 Tax=Shouchella patagoniensis TaxID=228576 RepID=UPI000994BB11|nr:glucuronate isomerase [Shouchella patagoniensis]